MKTTFKTMTDIISEKQENGHTSECPLDPSVIPNSMGINLGSVEGMSWTRQDDDQLVSLTINFIPKTRKEEDSKNEDVLTLKMPKDSFIKHGDVIISFEKPHTDGYSAIIKVEDKSGAVEHYFTEEQYDGNCISVGEIQ